MGIKRFVANKDTTITNAYKGGLTTVASSSNMGAADILEVFTIYAQANTSSREEARTLLGFSTSDISAARTAGDIPASGSVNFYLRMFNAEHSMTLPTDYTLQVSPITKSWDEGYGLDMDNYTDPGYPSGLGTTWGYAASGSTWDAAGGDIDSTTHNYTASVGSDGTDDLEVNITPLVEDWLNSLANNGLAVRIPAATSSLNRSFYTKRYFARGSEFFFKRPIIEARWETSDKDNAGNFYVSSSMAADNSNKLFLYNVFRGQKQNIPSVGTSKLDLNLYATLGGESLSSATASWSSIGVYTASITLDNTASVVYAVWSTGSTQFHTSSAITVNSHAASNYNPNPTYVSKITNLRSSYSTDETARFRIYARQKDWSPTIYTVASNNIETSIIEDAYFKVVRSVDDYEVIGFGTGSVEYTLTSYDSQGNYFDLDMSMFQKDYAYEIVLAYKINDKIVEQKETFKFRVE